MKHRMILCTLAMGLLWAPGVLGQAAVDTSKIGPQVGAVAPAFSGTDQTGSTRSLKTSAGPRGTMLVFFRSADW